MAKQGKWWTVHFLIKTNTKFANQWINFQLRTENLSRLDITFAKELELIHQVPNPRNDGIWSVPIFIYYFLFLRITTDYYMTFPSMFKSWKIYWKQPRCCRMIRNKSSSWKKRCEIGLIQTKILKNRVIWQIYKTWFNVTATPSIKDKENFTPPSSFQICPDFIFL